PLFERGGSVGAADSASHGGSRARAHFSVRVGLLRGVAFAPGLGAVALRRRGAAGGAPASRSDSARATLGLCTAQEAHASNGGGDSGAKFQELARGAGQKGQSDLRAQVREGRREVKSDLLAGTGAYTAAGSGSRIAADVPSNRKLKFVLSHGESEEYRSEPSGTSG